MPRVRMRVKWMAVLVVAIFVHHAWLWVVQNVGPFPETFGRETVLAATAADMPPAVFPDRTIVAPEGDFLVFYRFDPPAGPWVVKKMPVPHPSFKRCTQYAVAGDTVYWIAGRKLSGSRLSGGEWGPVFDLGEAVSFDVKVSDQRTYLAVSDDRQLRISVRTGDAPSPWSSVPIQDAARVKIDFHPNGNLLIASLAEYGTAGKALWWTEWDSRQAKVIRQAKLRFSRTDGSGNVISFALKTDRSAANLLYAVETANGGESVHLTRIPLNNPDGAQTVEVPVGDISGRFSGRRTDSPVCGGENDTFQTVIAKDGQVFWLCFWRGEKIGEERISAKSALAAHPVLTENGGDGTRVAVWLRRGLDGTFQIAAAGDHPEYRNQMNRIRLRDVLLAAGQLPTLLAGSAFALAASVKWLVLPYLLTGILRLPAKRLKRLDGKAGFWGAVALYLAVKSALIGQFYGAGTIVYMPAWMLPFWSRYLLVAGIAAAGLSVSAGGPKRGKNGRPGEKETALGAFSRFVLADLLLTVMWYGFFIRV